MSEGTNTLHLRLTNGSTHEMDPKTPGNYQISTFEHTDLPIPVPQADSGKEQEQDRPDSTDDIFVQGRHPDADIHVVIRILLLEPASDRIHLGARFLERDARFETGVNVQVIAIAN